MIGIFKRKNPANALLLLVYALVLKFNIFLHPLPPVQQAEDHFLYNWLLQVLTPLHLAPVFYSILVFLLLVTQATLFNRVCNVQKMFAHTNYLPGMAYLLATSLFTEWNQFSAPLLVNSLLIWIFYRITDLYSASKPGVAIFNVGVLTGIVTLLYEPAVFFVVLVWIGLFIMRPFRLQEWFISLLGITFPYYFLVIALYLTNQWHWNILLPSLSFGLPAMPSSIQVTISIILVILPFFIGGFLVQQNMTKMLIQVRKNWSVLLIYLIISVAIILTSGRNNYINWSLCIVPFAAFHAAAWYFPHKKWFPLILHWLLFAYAIYLAYWG